MAWERSRVLPASLELTRRWQRSFGRLLLYPLTVLLSLGFMFPFLWAVLSSFKTPQDMYAYPPRLFPTVWTISNYIEAFIAAHFVVWYRNTIVVVVLATVGTVVTATMVAYGFSRFDFRFKNILFMATLATLMLPGQVSLIPRYILFYHLGMVNTLYPLWLPYWFGGGAFAIFLLRQFLLTLPRDLDEAAIIDGASYIRILWQILVPLCRPAIATLAILSFITHWESFIDPVIFLHSSDQFTVAVGLNFFKSVPDIGGRPTDQLLMAAAITSVIPPVLLFFAFQRYFVRGIVLSGLKG